MSWPVGLLDLETDIAELNVLADLVQEIFLDAAERPVKADSMVTLELTSMQLEKLFLLIGQTAERSDKLRALYRHACADSRRAALETVGG